MTGSPPGKKVSAGQVMREVLTPEQRKLLLNFAITFGQSGTPKERELAQIIEQNWNGR